jgi:hypothetical protein
MTPIIISVMITKKKKINKYEVKKQEVIYLIKLNPKVNSKS